MTNNDIGYHEDPKNSNGIKRARTTKQIRSWELPKAIKALEALNAELGKIEFPGTYILLERKSKIYVGEAKNIYNRLKTHINSPDEKIKNWDTVIVINDGRPAMQSDFNDSVVRKAIELFLIKLFKANKYDVVSQGESQKLNANQRFIVDSLILELEYFLLKKNIIYKVLEERGQEEIFSDELEKIIKKSGKRVRKLGKYEAIIDNEKAFIRPSSKKPKGWQITFRGSFLESFRKGKGHLLVSRDGVLLIPLSVVQTAINEAKAFEQDTIDIWILFKENKATLTYKKNTIDVSEYRLVK